MVISNGTVEGCFWFDDRAYALSRRTATGRVAGVPPARLTLGDRACGKGPSLRVCTCEGDRLHQKPSVPTLPSMEIWRWPASRSKTASRSVPIRFALVLLAAQRARDISAGAALDGRPRQRQEPGRGPARDRRRHGRRSTHLRYELIARPAPQSTSARSRRGPGRGARALMPSQDTGDRGADAEEVSYGQQSDRGRGQRSGTDRADGSGALSARRRSGRRHVRGDAAPWSRREPAAPRSSPRAARQPAPAALLRQYELVERVKAYDPDADEDLLNRAYVFAMKAHGASCAPPATPISTTRSRSPASSPDYKLDTRLDRHGPAARHGRGHRRHAATTSSACSASRSARLVDGRHQAQQAGAAVRADRAGRELPQAAAGDVATTSGCCWSSSPTACTTCARCSFIKNPDKRRRIARRDDGDLRARWPSASAWRG